jgi:hypothetical protein
LFPAVRDFSYVIYIFIFFSPSTSLTRPRSPTSRSSRCVTGTTYSTTRTISPYSRTPVSIHASRRPNHK